MSSSEQPLEPLISDSVDARYEPASKLLLVTYKGKLSPEVTTAFYKWLIPAVQTNPELVAAARGSIYDFRQVTEFVSSNMSTARSQSQSANQSMDLQNHPVALVVDTLMQETMVGVMMKLTEQTERKRIARSMDEAMDYINQWHAERETAE